MAFFEALQPNAWPGQTLLLPHDYAPFALNNPQSTGSVTVQDDATLADVQMSSSTIISLLSKFTGINLSQASDVGQCVADIVGSSNANAGTILHAILECSQTALSSVLGLVSVPLSILVSLLPDLVETITGAFDDSFGLGRISVTVTPPSSQSMNFQQIESGKYSSLAGSPWKEIGYGVNPSDGTGTHYYSGGTDKLSVSSSEIDNSPNMTMSGTNIYDQAGAKSLTFTTSDGVLSAGLTNQNAAINWEVDFYPKGCGKSPNIDGNQLVFNGTPVSNSENVIVIWSSSNSYTEVFTQTASGRG